MLYEFRCGAPASTINQGHFRDPGYLHKVILKGLKSEQRYYYRFGSDEQQRWSAVYSFKARAHGRQQETKFLAYGDMGVGDAEVVQLRAAIDVENGYDDFLLHIGNIR